MKGFLLFILILFLFTISVVAQEAVPKTITEQPTSFWISLLTNSDVINIILPILAFFFAGIFTWLVTKLRTAGKLLIAFADAIEDKKIDANERVDLAYQVRALFKGSTITKVISTTIISTKDNNEKEVK